MNEKQIISRLNWFYSLEVEQVDLYKTQSQLITDQYLSRAFNKFAEIEQTHVDNIASLIKNFGGTPTKVGEVIGQLTGKITGNLIQIADIKKQLEVNILLERKAMEDYKDMILKSGHEDLFETLWNNLIDEDLHRAWMADKVNELNKKQHVKV